MKLENIKVRNYRGKNFDFAPGKINLMLKPNGSGKTSLQDAIRYGITGQTPMKDDPRGMSVEIDFGNGLVSERGKDKTTICKLNGKRVTETALNDAISGALGMELANVRMTSSSEVLLNLKPDDLLKFMLKYIPENLDYETVMDYFTQRNGDIDAACSEVFPLMPETFSIDEIDRAYDRFYAERRNLKASLAEKKACLESITATEPERDMKAIDEDILSISVQEKNSAETDKKHKEWEEAKKKKEDLEAKIKDLKSKMEQVKCDEPTQEQLNTIKEKQRKYQDARSQCNGILNVAKKNVEYYTKALKDLDRPVCPLSDKLICTTDKTAVKEEIKGLLEENEKMAKSAATKMETIKKNIEKCDRNMQVWNDRNQKHQLFVKYETQAKAYEEAMPVLAEEPPKAEAPENLAEKKKILEAEKKNAEDFEKMKKLQKDVDDLSSKVKTRDIIISALADKGEVKTGIIRYYIDLFTSQVNSRAKAVAPGYEIRFEVGDGVHIFAKTPSNRGFYPLKALSNGETTIVSALILDMFVSLSGSRIMFIDNLESLDKASLKNMRSFVETLAESGEYDHIFLSGVDHREVIDVFDGIKAVRL